MTDTRTAHLYNWRHKNYYFTDDRTRRWYLKMPLRLLKEDYIALSIERLELFLKGKIDLAVGKLYCPINASIGCEECPLPQEACFDLEFPQDIEAHLTQKTLPALRSLHQHREA